MMTRCNADCYVRPPDCNVCIPKSTCVCLHFVRCQQQHWSLYPNLCNRFAKLHYMRPPYVLPRTMFGVRMPTTARTSTINFDAMWIHRRICTYCHNGCFAHRHSTLKVAEHQIEPVEHALLVTCVRVVHKCSQQISISECVFLIRLVQLNGYALDTQNHSIDLWYGKRIDSNNNHLKIKIERKVQILRRFWKSFFFAFVVDAPTFECMKKKTLNIDLDLFFFGNLFNISAWPRGEIRICKFRSTVKKIMEMANAKPYCQIQ